MINGTNPISYAEYAANYLGRSFLPGGTGLTLAALNNYYTPNPVVKPAPEPEKATSIPTPPVSSIGDALGINTGIGSSITGAVNSFGTQLGFGGVTPQFVGPLQPGVGIGVNAGTLSSASLSSVLGAAGLGYLGGGIFADLVGLNSKGGSIGGGIGAGIAAGAGLGPVGMVAGGILGSIGGGLFGGKKPNPASTVGSDYGVNPDGTFVKGGVVRSKHLDNSFGQKMRDTVNVFNQSIHQQTGIDLSKSLHTLYAGYDVNQGPGFISFNSTFKNGQRFNNPDATFYFDPNNKQSMVEAFRQYGSKLLETTGQEFSPENVNKIVNTALSSLAPQAAQGTTTVPRTDVLIKRNIPTEDTFDNFLKKYREKYNANAVR